MNRSSIFPYWALILIAAMTLLGCQTIRSNDGLLEQQSADANVSSRQLRIVLDDLVLQFSSQIEQAADQILAENNDPQIRKHALMWKTNGIANCFQAASRRDPLGAYFDIWILNKQSLELFQRPTEDPLFGDSQSIAILASEQIELVMSDVLQLLGNDLPIDESFVTDFTADHPVNDLYFNRASITANYTKYIDHIKIDEPELLGIVGDINEQLDQVQRLSSMYAEFLPKQARWNGELMLLEAMGSTAVRTSLQNISLAADGVARIADTTQAVPNLIERERNLLHDAIRTEREATMLAIDQMRAETVGQLQQERIAVMGGLETERKAVLLAIHQERMATTEDLSQLGERTLHQVDQAVDLKITTLANHGSDLIDQGFKRGIQLLAVLAPLTLLLTVTFFVVRNRRRPSINADSTPVTQMAIRVHRQTPQESHHRRHPGRRTA
jgi:hypothetical protein